MEITLPMWFCGIILSIIGGYIGYSCEGDAAQRAGGTFIGAAGGLLVGFILGFLLGFTSLALPGRGEGFR